MCVFLVGQWSEGQPQGPASRAGSAFLWIVCGGTGLSHHTQLTIESPGLPQNDIESLTYAIPRHHSLFFHQPLPDLLLGFLKDTSFLFLWKEEKGILSCPHIGVYLLGALGVLAPDLWRGLCQARPPWDSGTSISGRSPGDVSRPCSESSFLSPQTLTRELLSAREGGDTVPTALWGLGPEVQLWDYGQRNPCRQAGQQGEEGGQRGAVRWAPFCSQVLYLQNDPNSVGHPHKNKQQVLSKVPTETTVRSQLSRGDCEGLLC